MTLSLIILSASLILFASFLAASHVRRRKKDSNPVRVPPARTIEIQLKDCKILTRTEYVDPQVPRHERYDALFGMGGDPASKRICVTVSRLQYSVPYSEGTAKFVSNPIFLDELTLKMRMFDAKTTTLDIYENGSGEITDVAFNLEFLNRKTR